MGKVVIFARVGYWNIVQVRNYTGAVTICLNSIAADTVRGLRPQF